MCSGEAGKHSGSTGSKGNLSDESHGDSVRTERVLGRGRVLRKEIRQESALTCTSSIETVCLASTGLQDCHSHIGNRGECQKGLEYKNVCYGSLGSPETLQGIPSPPETPHKL